MRLKSNQSVLALWVVAAVTGAWTIYGFVDFVRKKGEYLTPIGAAAIREEMRGKSAPPKARAQARSWDAYKNLYDLNVVNKRPPVLDAGIDLPLILYTTAAAPVADLLRVMYVQVDESDPDGTRPYLSDEFAGNRCFVQYKDDGLKKDADPFLTPGDALPEPHGAIVVKAIFPSRVVFRRESGEEEVLVPEFEVAEEVLRAIALEGEGAATQPTSLPVAAKTAAKNWPGSTVEEKPNQYKVGTDDFAALEARHTDILAREITVTPHYRKGDTRPNGLRIASIKADSVLAGKGLQAGDVVRSINGTPVHSKEQVLEYAQAHSDLRTFTLEIERWGALRTIQYSLPR